MNQSGRLATATSEGFHKQSAGKRGRHQQPPPSSATIRRHSRNRLVLIGRPAAGGSTGANKTAQRRDRHEPTAGERRMMIDDPLMTSNGECENDVDAEMDDPEVARKHPSKLTHGFWLRRYSGLHGAGAGTTFDKTSAVTNTQGQLCTSEGGPRGAGSKPASHAGARSQVERPCLLTRWTNAMVSRGRAFGGATSRMGAEAHGSGAFGTQSHGRSSASSTPPPSSLPAVAHDTSSERQQRLRQRTSARCLRKRTRTTGGDDRHPETGASGNGGHNPFGCQFCGWRSGAHVTSSSSSSSTPSLLMSPSETPVAPAASKRAHRSASGHRESRMRPTDTTAADQTVGLARSQQQKARRMIESSGGGGQSLFSNWLLRSVSSTAVASSSERKQECGSGCGIGLDDRRRMSPYKQVVRLLGARKQHGPGAATLSNDEEQQTGAGSGDTSKVRLLAAILFISPKRRRANRRGASSERQPEARPHLSGKREDEKEERQQHSCIVANDKSEMSANEISSKVASRMVETDKSRAIDERQDEQEEKSEHFKVARSQDSLIQDSSYQRPNEPSSLDREEQQRAGDEPELVHDESRLSKYANERLVELEQCATADMSRSGVGFGELEVSLESRPKETVINDGPLMSTTPANLSDQREEQSVDSGRQESEPAAMTVAAGATDDDDVMKGRLVSMARAEFAAERQQQVVPSHRRAQHRSVAVLSGQDNTKSNDNDNNNGAQSYLAASPSSEASAIGAVQTITSSASLLPLIRPFASSSSSFASSSICNLESTLTTESISQQHLDAATDQDSSQAAVGAHQQQPDPGLVVVSTLRESQESAWITPAPIEHRNYDINDGEGQYPGDAEAKEPSRGRQQQANRPRSQPVSSSGTSEISPAAEAATTTTKSTMDKSTTELLKSNFKKLVKRQQSVDSYRMAREQKQKLKREQQERAHPGASGTGTCSAGGGRQHQSNEAIRTCSHGVADLRQVSASARKFSMSILTKKDASSQETAPGPKQLAVNLDAADSTAGGDSQVEICVDPYAQAGSFMLPGEQVAAAGSGSERTDPKALNRPKDSKGPSKPSACPTPPKTLSLMPMGNNGGGCSTPGSLLIGSGFSGCITPTYPTHHLPSPKYVSPAAFAAMQKKHSNASTISSSLGVDSLAGVAIMNQNGHTGNDQSLLFDSITSMSTTTTTAAANLQETQTAGGRGGGTKQQQDNGGGSGKSLDGVGPETGDRKLAAGQEQEDCQASALTQEQAEARAAAEAEAAAAAQRRANLAEHIYDNKCGLGEDMKFLASVPEMCDITFLVGETREPVCAVKSVLAARSRVFHKILFGSRIKAAAAAAATAAAAQRQATTESSGLEEPIVGQTDDGRRGSSPRQGALNVLASVTNLAPKSSLPNSRSSSPNQQTQSSQHQQWSVTSDAGGFSSTRPAPVARADSTVTTSGVGGGRSGRMSVASNGRESVSQANQGIQQPLIIGPGQTATPAPIKKGKKGRRDDQMFAAGHHQGAMGGHSRLSRMFMNKRASDPSIKHQQQQQLLQGTDAGVITGPLAGASDGSNISAAQGYHGSGAANQSYLDKMSSSQRSTTMIIEEFEPDVFRQLIEYIHTGCVLLQARTLLGLLNAADYYGLEQLRRACLRFVSCCITVDTVCSLLSTAERYIQYKCTKSIVQKVLGFVDTHANDIFKLNAFGLLPEHVVRLILARDGLQADEHVKYNGVYTWCEHYCRSYELTNMSDVMRNFLDLIHFHKIPTNVLLTEIYPTHIVPDEIFLSALAYQADPEMFEPQPSRQRRMTLPSSLMLGRSPYDDEQADEPMSHRRIKGATSRRQSNSPAAARAQNRRSIVGKRKSKGNGIAGGSSVGGPTPSPIQVAPSKPQARKGSFAQVSISGVKRLSHKLPLRKRHSNMQSGGSPSAMTMSPLPPPQLAASQGASVLQHTSSVAVGPVAKAEEGTSNTRSGKRQLSLAQSSVLSEQPNSAVTAAALAASAAADSNLDHSRDPIQLGRQILDAYLAAKRQQELEEECRRREAEAADARKSDSESIGGGPPEDPCRAGGRNSDSRSSTTRHQPLVKTSSSSHKSFRDFKHISRRLFMRHSSSKSIQLQQQSSLTGSSSGGGGGGGAGSSSGQIQTKRMNSSDASGTRLLSIDKKHSADFQHKQQCQEIMQTPKGRRLLRIKRSETVFESTVTNSQEVERHNTSKLLHQLSANLKKS